MAGMDSTCGFASWIGNTKTANDEGVLVRHLRALGAVIYCKTNVPMGALVNTSRRLVHVYTSSTDNCSHLDGRDGQ